MHRKGSWAGRGLVAAVVEAAGDRHDADNCTTDDRSAQEQAAGAAAEQAAATMAAAAAITIGAAFLSANDIAGLILQGNDRNRASGRRSRFRRPDASDRLRLSVGAIDGQV